jgi:ribosomal protein S18
MKVVGFTFIRNAVKYDYPIVEAINSILPVCSKFVVAVGRSDDKTRELIGSLSSDKIEIVDTVWDDSLREGGRVLAVETDKAYAAIDDDADWCFYIQGDEVVHEKYLPAIENAMKDNLNDKNVDGLVFKYLHFYGSYDYIGESYRWYRSEVRIIRKLPTIYSYRDAQGFRKNNNKALNVREANAYVYHYGWVKPPEAMQRKQEDFNKLWHDDEWIDKNIPKAAEFDYSKIDALKRFLDKHPKVMQDRIERLNWKFDYDISASKLKTKDKVKRFFETLGWDFGQYKNYRLLK